MGKKKSKTQSHSQTVEKIPAWLEEGSQQAVGMARATANNTYTPYEGQRVAGISTDEQAAVDLGREQGSSYQPLMYKAEDQTDLATQNSTFAEDATKKADKSWLEADRQAYMNPYVEGALEPAANKIRENTAIAQRDAGAQAGVAGAFGGSRATLLQTEAGRTGNQQLADTYKEGFKNAYDDAYSKFDGDRNNFLKIADSYRASASDRRTNASSFSDQATQSQNQVTQEMNNLLTTGGLSRQLEQAGMNFDYQQFSEARGWDTSNLAGLIAALSAVPHGQEVTADSSSTTTKKGDVLSAVVGAATAAAGAITVDPATLKSIFGSAGAPEAAAGTPP